jgi:YVTN family beta-propeller protein
MKCMPILALIACVGLLTGCGANPSFPVQTGRPAFDPTPTTEVTQVPLVLTPISTAHPLPALPPLVDSQSSKALALTTDTLITVNSDSDSVTLVDLNTAAVVVEIAVGDDPRTVAVTPDDAYALVTLRGEHALAVVDLIARRLDRVLPVCHMPYGVVSDGRRAFVSCFGEDQIAVLDLETGTALYRVPVPDAPAGLVISGEWLLATHFYSGQVSVLNVQRTPVLVGSVNVEPDGNLAASIVVSPDGQQAFIPQTRTGLALVSLQYMQDWFPIVGVLDIASGAGDRSARLTVTMLDTAANLPSDVAFDDSGGTLYIVLAGTDAVLVVDRESREVLARVSVGANPRGIVVDGERAFVLNAFDGTISVIGDSHAVLNTIDVTDLPLNPQVLRGKILFHSAAPALSDGAISCATCHPDGGADARTWINFRSGPRNTPALGGISAMPPYNWAGDMAELHDTIEDQIRSVMLGDGLITSGPFDPTAPYADAGRSADLDALAAYVASLEAWPSPYREPDGSLSESAERGMALFLSGSPNCSCHTPPLFTDLQQHNLSGTAFSTESFEAFDTPTLRGLWATAPYMHDGVAQTLEEVLTRTDPVHSVAHAFSAQQLADLIAYLLSL